MTTKSITFGVARVYVYLPKKNNLKQFLSNLSANTNEDRIQ